jgi:hypothetical protein
MAYVEEREFELRFELKCEFPDDYQGEEDGYAWAEEWPTIAAEVLRQVVATIGRHPGWSVRTRNRGRSTDDEVTLVLERAPR